MVVFNNSCDDKLISREHSLHLLVRYTDIIPLTFSQSLYYIQQDWTVLAKASISKAFALTQNANSVSVTINGGCGMNMYAADKSGHIACPVPCPYLSVTSWLEIPPYSGAAVM